MTVITKFFNYLFFFFLPFFRFSPFNQMSILEIISIIENSGMYNNEIFLSILLFNENYIVNYYFK